MYLNARSAAKTGAIDAISTYADTYGIDLFFLTETWFSDSITNAKLSLGNKFQAIRLDCSTRGGGVCILYRNSIEVRPVPHIGQSELVAIDLIGAALTLRLACCYLTKTGDAATRLERTSQCVDDIARLCSVDHPIIILGDFNFPSVDWTAPNFHDEELGTTKESVFLNCCGFYDSQQMVHFPTHDSGNTLDLILTTNPEMLSDMSSTAGPVVSDHRAIRFDLPTSSGITPPPPPSLDYRLMDERSIAEHLNQRFPTWGPRPPRGVQKRFLGGPETTREYNTKNE